MSALEQAVADLLLKATAAAEAAGRFAVEQLPDVAQQYVLYVAIKSWGYVSLGILFLVLASWLFKKCWQCEEVLDEGPILFMGGAASLIAGGLLTLINFEEAIMATWAPKVLLIQWAAELLK